MRQAAEHRGGRVAALGATLLALGAAVSAAAHADLGSVELAKLAQNPVGNLVTVPFQNNTNFGVDLRAAHRTSSTFSRVPDRGQQGLERHHADDPAARLAAGFRRVHPNEGANWQLRAQVQLMFPK